MGTELVVELPGALVERRRPARNGNNHRSRIAGQPEADAAVAAPAPPGTNWHGAAGHELEVSIVFPCLNEAASVGVCVKKAVAALKANNLCGEVVVSDNGSTDGSVEIARAAGARVVHAPLRGYGNAYMKGFDEARGRYVLMADSDNTYDVAELPRFLNLLRQGYDLVMGSRFKGNILPGAMPWMNRYIGNPALSGLLNLFFRTGIGDAHSGLRAFSKEAYGRMRLQTGGMEFASEMVINASRVGLKMTEVPITYYPRAGESKLHPFRDGWRHLRFMLLYSPTYLYLWPGALMMLIGFAVLLPMVLGPLQQFLSGTYGLHWMFVASLLAILGFQLINLGFFARVYSLTSHLDDTRDQAVTFFTRRFKMETGLLLGALIFSAGLATYGFILWTLLRGHLTVPESVRLSILALTLTVIGAQSIFSSFFISMMVMKRRGMRD
ncbi:MAG: glycosyltransferase [Chloroflexi bacterium]|nr:glycosyltransferase [Chloroflexota bacterium]